MKNQFNPNELIMSELNNWRDKRDQILSQAKLIVIKVGSAVLTSPEGVDEQVVSRLADQIANLIDSGKQVILVSSGAVPAGKNYLRSHNIEHTLPEKQAAAAIGQSRLMHIYDKAFEQYNKITAQVLLTRDDLRSRHRFLNARNTFYTLLGNNAIPIVNENDTVVVQELEFGENDFLASLILNLVQADLFINLTSAQGVFAQNPEQNPAAEKIDCIPCIKDWDIESLCDGKTSAGSGGMHTKMLAGRRAAQLGVPTLIVSGKEPFVLEKVFSGLELGTWILPDEKVVSQKKFWFAYNLDPVGSLVIDKGAVEALMFNGKSLLPAGIVDVNDAFQSRDLVKILDTEGKQVGVGITRFDSSDLKKIMGRKSKELDDKLGYSVDSAEAIHRDEMLLDAVH